MILEAASAAARPSDIATEHILVKGESLELRYGGLPCRAAGCRLVFFVRDQTSLDSLMAAGSTRNAHEIAEHDYHHAVMPAQRPYNPFGSRPAPAK